MIDYSKLVTAEMKAERARLAVLDMRRAAYREESDPLKLEAEYDAMRNNIEPDYSAWMAKVEEIKSRYPLPEAPNE